MKRFSASVAHCLTVFALICGLVTSSSGRLHGASIPGLYNSGVDDSGIVQPVGSSELHLSMTGLRTNATVIQPAAPWTVAPPGSAWIGPLSGSQNAPSGCCYIYTLPFDLTGYDPTTAFITGNLASDDGTRIFLNGTDIGFDNADVTFQVLRPFTISSGFLPGTNVLEFRVSNCDLPECTFNPSGLLVANLAGTVERAGPSVRIYWDGNAAVLPDEINPPWRLVSTANTSAYRASDAGLPVAYLVSTQAVDNVYFEQTGSSLQMTNHLIIEAVLRIVDGETTVLNRGPAGITFTVARNVGGSLWLNQSNMFVTAGGDMQGASTNLDTTTQFHTVRIEVQGLTNGSPYTVFYDQVAVLEGSLYNSPSTFGSEPRIQWGDISDAAHGESHWFSFSHNAARPFTTLTNPAVQLACTHPAGVIIPPISAPFLSLVSEGRITDGTSPRYSNAGLLFNTDSGIIYEVLQGGVQVLDSAPRRRFIQSDGSEIVLFEFTDLTFAGISVRVTGSRAAAILATGNIQVIDTHIAVDASGDIGAPIRTEHDPGFDAPVPLGGGGGRGVASAYSGGEPPFLVPGKLPTSGPGGGGFAARGQDGFPAEPVRMWKYNGPPTFDFTLLGTLHRPGGEGGAPYNQFNVLRGGGAGGSSSGTGFAGNSGLPGGHGGGALLISTPGQIFINNRSVVSVDGQGFSSYLSEIAAGGAGGYLVLKGDQGIVNQGGISARGGAGRKNLVSVPSTSPPNTISWGSCGDGSGGFIVLLSASGVTNSGSILFTGGAASEICTLGALQTQTPRFVNLLPQLLNSVHAGGQFTFSFAAATNQSYEVQRNDDLNTTNWVTFTNLVGAGLPANIFSPTPGVTNRFFRLLLR